MHDGARSGLYPATQWSKQGKRDIVPVNWDDIAGMRQSMSPETRLAKEEAIDLAFTGAERHAPVGSDA